jgi:anti-sigma-K factor RskA
MSATMPHEPLESGDLAGEYVLGVLDAAARREAATRVGHDRGFAREVAAWESRLAPLAGEIAPVTPPDVVWTRIRATLGHAAPEKRETFWDRVDVWRRMALGAFAIAATACVIAWFVAQRPVEIAPPTPLVAVMAGDDGKPAFVASVDRKSGDMVVTPVGGWSDAAHVPELWLIPPGATKPLSLGVVGANNAAAMRIPAALLADLRASATLAISVEPPGGSPTGQPTGPVVAKGSLASI